MELQFDMLFLENAERKRLWMEHSRGKNESVLKTNENQTLFFSLPFFPLLGCYFVVGGDNVAWVLVV